ncbi:MAG: hypothetical protein EA409_05845 [Saprospirales bacterium]|nr:MAG: hypothetical protein EA409_05845 [Saprospirales bacterium]
MQYSIFNAERSHSPTQPHPRELVDVRGSSFMKVNGLCIFCFGAGFMTLPANGHSLLMTDYSEAMGYLPP